VKWRHRHVSGCCDGKVTCRARVGAPGAYCSSPVAADGRVYLASPEGVVTVIPAGKHQLEVLARNDLDENIVATPVILRNTIYVRTPRNHYALEGR
jgi:outer membrane protein assembly factor BamB